MRKPDFCLCENKGTDQLSSNCTADQHLCFRYLDGTIPLLLVQNFKLLACFCDGTGLFVSDMLGNSEDRFSRVAAHIIRSRNARIALPSTISSMMGSTKC